MKFRLLVIAFASLSISSTGAFSATVTSDYLGTSTLFPGSSSDFSLFGNQTTYPGNTPIGGTGGQPTNLTDFSISSSGEHVWGGGNKYSTITAPDGHSYLTGVIFNPNRLADPAIATVTLGSTAGFDYGDFNLYVMFGNGDANGNNNQALTVTVDGTTYTANVTDEQTTNNGNYAQFEEFNIQGLSAGDAFTVGSVTSGGLSYLGGLSFSEAPEPSTTALMVLGGLGLLMLVRRRRVA